MTKFPIIFLFYNQKEFGKESNQQVLGFTSGRTRAITNANVAANIRRWNN